ncbi:TetR family transcriptional regulator C-terminal domain-containing protein [Tenacibaculum finnmarkense]|uniref:TetR family transcriptional regulator C-terminal domain-containing protein n=1 Tax=Tenacibaculum finnmarkense TaxID=2781243 RepID=UPI00187B70BA|nr:TetR family transcriptional regulator C-terminal domain-containing protein [Tenacibaculum finnmarkense]MBE7659958.1 TetR/AcrR family transcriptional regulator [Tenacibaculum finnmarkense genomovar finnmarkense]MCG8207375.1 TetR/AcrR family transcriptional regulator [Tenacibaculum finnmarkense genomovar finnmarkense]MCG8251644.1 TetR/AcrR family transcriptional regulator [Tenacibaculum finnmarkense genomovar finnmarkense]MCG8722782.1 TetR/AcrR family transcriptional regulator [Tenacibaculum f
MENKETITEDKIIELYMNSVLISGKPTSIYAFATDNNFEESEFYQYFSSFKSLEKSIFGVFAKETIHLLHKTEAYKDYTSKDKLLSFYFTFFELLTANRSYVLWQFQDMKSDFSKLAVLKELRSEFLKYISEIEIEKIDFKNDKINKIQDKTITEAYWMQLLMILKFWIDDESSNFEKTDVFIEKSVKAAFDIQQITPVKSVIDLAKFLWKEKGTSV